jgi:hypothetical protein
LALGPERFATSADGESIMALGALTLTATDVKGPSEVIAFYEISLVGDAAYATGGTAGLEAALQALTKNLAEILCVVSIGANGGFVPDLGQGQQEADDLHQQRRRGEPAPGVHQRRQQLDHHLQARRVRALAGAIRCS